MSHLRLRYVLISICIICTSNPALFAQGSANVPLLAHVNDHASANYNDCWGYTAPDGREYALLGVFNGTAIIDITDVNTAAEVAFIPSVNTPWKDIKTFSHYAYVVTDGQGQGMQILDLSTLPDSVKLVATYTGNNFTLSHDISVDEPNAMLYAAGERTELVRAISLADPLKPVQVSTFGIECHDMLVRNNIVYVAEGTQGSVGIFDLSNPTTPNLLARVSIPAPGYVHNVWPSEDGNYMMTTEETVGKTVKYWDIRDLNNVQLLSEYLAPDQLAHNAHIKGNFAYISHYKDGLRVVDLSDPDSIAEVGFYDTFPGSGDIFDGAWGAFPFFNSNKVLISDISTGLYVVQFDPVVSSVADQVNVPEQFSLGQNYPNPFNPETTISYDLKAASQVVLQIYNLQGQEVRTLVNGRQAAGVKTVRWDGKNNAGRALPSGLYIYRIAAGNFSATRKMVLQK